MNFKTNHTYWFMTFLPVVTFLLCRLICESTVEY